MTEIEPLLAGAFGCSDEVARRAAPLFRTRSLARGHSFFLQGEPCDRCWLMVEGSAELRIIGLDGQLTQLTSYGPGELAGAFPDARRQPAELVAAVPSTALEAKGGALSALAAAEPELGAGLAALLARQQELLLSRIARRIGLSAAGRVYAELLHLADAEGRIAPAPVIASLAVRVNTTRETASRAVAAAERRGLLRRVAGGLHVVSLERLESLAV
jgi:CRP-like cAMP-binding protein